MSGTSKGTHRHELYLLFRSDQLLMDDQDDATIGIVENPLSDEQDGYHNPGFASMKEEEEVNRSYMSDVREVIL